MIEESKEEAAADKPALTFNDSDEYFKAEPLADECTIGAALNITDVVPNS